MERIFEILERNISDKIKENIKQLEEIRKHVEKCIHLEKGGKCSYYCMLRVDNLRKIDADHILDIAQLDKYCITNTNFKKCSDYFMNQRGIRRTS